MLFLCVHFPCSDCFTVGVLAKGGLVLASVVLQCAFCVMPHTLHCQVRALHFLLTPCLLHLYTFHFIEQLAQAVGDSSAETLYLEQGSWLPRVAVVLSVTPMSPLGIYTRFFPSLLRPSARGFFPGWLGPGINLTAPSGSASWPGYHHDHGYFLYFHLRH